MGVARDASSLRGAPSPAAKSSALPALVSVSAMVKGGNRSPFPAQGMRSISWGKGFDLAGGSSRVPRFRRSFAIVRPSKRAPDALRPISLERRVSRHAEGSCLVRFGETHVLCTATAGETVPQWLKGSGKGWVTAEYGMLPRATNEQTRREAAAGKQSGRTQEIQRLIGRSLRAVTDLTMLSEKQIVIDCDVLQADGGTRTASITGAWIALYDAVQWMKARNMLKGEPIRDHVAAVSCGLYD